MDKLWTNWYTEIIQMLLIHLIKFSFVHLALFIFNQNLQLLLSLFPKYRKTGTVEITLYKVVQTNFWDGVFIWTSLLVVFNKIFKNYFNQEIIERFSVSLNLVNFKKNCHSIVFNYLLELLYKDKEKNWNFVL